MRHGSLFSGGCDGFSLAAQWMGWTNVFHVEIEKWNQALLKQNYPDSEIYGDIREFNEREAANYRGRIDILTGGFPCQPFSAAGKKKGTQDDRYLWPTMLETIRIIQPTFIIGENVAGLTTMEDGLLFERILTSLEDEGYAVESFILPSAGCEGGSERKRVWITAYSMQKRLQGSICQHGSHQEISGRRPSRKTQHPLTGLRYDVQGSSEHLRRDSRVPNWTQRIEALGNSIDPRVAYELFRAIEITFELTPLGTKTE